MFSTCVLRVGRHINNDLKVRFHVLGKTGNESLSPIDTNKLENKYPELCNIVVMA